MILSDERVLLELRHAREMWDAAVPVHFLTKEGSWHSVPPYAYGFREHFLDAVRMTCETPSTVTFYGHMHVRDDRKLLPACVPVTSTELATYIPLAHVLLAAVFLGFEFLFDQHRHPS